MDLFFSVSQKPGFWTTDWKKAGYQSGGLPGMIIPKRTGDLSIDIPLNHPTKI